MKITHPNGILDGMIEIAGSKSESNRVLMIGAYLGEDFRCENISDSNDTRLLADLLDKINNADNSTTYAFDCADAGTVCRFLVTYLAQKEGSWILTGNDRLRHRPIAPLVDSLVMMGADIRYTNEKESLPLFITGKKLKPVDIDIDVSMSSQFASSLLLMLPTLDSPVAVGLVGEPSSMPYLDMTIGIMSHFGANVSRNGMTISVLPSHYKAKPYHVSPDWSSASYWFEAAALCKSCHLALNGFYGDSIQGDKAVADMFARMGVSCSFKHGGMLLNKNNEIYNELVFDFTHTPDLFPALVATCAALNLKAVFKGVKNLKYKESDRAEALIRELSKAGAVFEIQSDSIVLQKGIDTAASPVFDTHNDHRIAMALAVMAIRQPVVRLSSHDVAKKSYRAFWNDMQKLGFCLEH